MEDKVLPTVGRADLMELDYAGVTALVGACGGSLADGRAVWQGLYRDAADSLEVLPALPPSVRERLVAAAALPTPQCIGRLESTDGQARKDLLRLADGALIEVVLLRYRQRSSGCISTQVGCGCGCRFCATGQMGFVRQLSAGEIVAQVMHLRRTLRAEGRDLDNFVLMGMGEPLLNYETTLAAVRRLVDQRGWSFPQRRITLSTVGIPAGIERLAGDGLALKLAVSLHGATDPIRQELVPIARRYLLDELFAALRTYTARTRQRVMLEWLLVDGLTDTPAQAEALVGRLAGLPAHVNLIRLNPTPGFEGRPASPEAVEAFTAALERAGVPHTMRQRRGAAIAAGCGQLAAPARSAGLP